MIIKNAPIPNSLPHLAINSHQITSVILPHHILAHLIQYLPQTPTPSLVAAMLFVQWLTIAVVKLTVSGEVVH